MARFLKRLVLVAVVAAAAWKLNELMTVTRESRTPELPRA
jgi:hypothetical protein